MWIAPVPAAAQSKPYMAPKMHDGHPDLQGIWQAHNTANDGLEAHSADVDLAPGLGVIVDPPDGKIPYQPAARAKVEQNYKTRADDDPVSKCFMPGVPRFTYIPFPFQIFQTPEKILMVSEYAHVVRTIFTDGSKHLDGIDFWMGDSRGHWEGDTLVVDVNDFNADTWFDKSGDDHSGDLHVVERFTRTAPNVLTYQATIEDPKTFTRPWTIRMPLYRNTQKDARMLEYECQSFGDTVRYEAPSQ
jgi:hypothetical protein